MNVSPDQVYRQQADFLLRESMHKLKGLVDLLCLGVLDDMDETEVRGRWKSFLGKW